MKSSILVGFAICFLTQSALAGFAKMSGSDEQRKKYEVQGATAIDTSTNMMWMRCNIGQSWSDQGCVDKAKAFQTFAEAHTAVKVLNQQKYLGYDDWQLPHIEDLASLIFCNNGYDDIEEIPTKNGNTKEIGTYCKENNIQRPTINSSVFPSTVSKAWYWSSSERPDRSGMVWGVVFYSGLPVLKKRSGNEQFDTKLKFIRAVRAVNETN